MKMKMFRTQAVNSYHHDFNDVLNVLAKEISKEILDEDIISVTAECVQQEDSWIYAKAIVSYKE